MNQQDLNYDRRWSILAILAIAQLMVVLDATVMNIALPSAQRALGFSNNERQWIITGYTLAFGSLLLLGGKLSDLFGRKWTLIIGLCGFAIASAAGGASQSFLMLAGARVVQGTFGALLAPSVLSLMTTTFADPDERNKAFGIFGGVLASGASIGLMLGGVLTEYINWRAVMYVNLVIAIVAVIGVLLLLVNERPSVRPHIDLAGAAIVTAGLFAIVFGFSHAETTSWRNMLTIGTLAAGVVLLALFVALEARTTHALLPLRVMAERSRGASFLTVAIAGGAMFGTFLFVTYYLQGIRGYTPLRTGFAFLPMTLVLMASSIIGSTLLRPHLGPRWLVTIGMALGAAGMLYLTRLAVDSAYAAGILPGLLLVGLGLGLVLSTAINSATMNVNDDDAGVVSATANASQQVGGSMGTALLSTVAASATASSLSGASANPTAIASADVHGFTVAFTWSAAMFAVGAVVALVMYKGGRLATASPAVTETNPELSVAD